MSPGLIKRRTPGEGSLVLGFASEPEGHRLTEHGFELDGRISRDGHLPLDESMDVLASKPGDASSACVIPSSSSASSIVSPGGDTQSG